MEGYRTNEDIVIPAGTVFWKRDPEFYTSECPDTELIEAETDAPGGSYGTMSHRLCLEDVSSHFFTEVFS